jgi:hypothetical protein
MEDFSMSDIWNKRRKALEEALRVAALNLAEHTGAYSFTIPLPNTTPPLAVSLAPKKDVA